MDINATLLGQMGTFLVLVWVTMKYVWPPVTQAMEERRQKIAEGLAAGEQGKIELEQAQQEISSQIQDAKQEAQQILQLAEKRGQEIIEAAKEKAKDEARNQIALAQDEIANETNRAREELRGQLATLVVSGAEQILKREIDSKTHASLLNDFSQRL